MFTLNELVEAFNAMETARKYGISWSAGPVSEDFGEKYDALTAAEKEEFEACLRLATENLGKMGAKVKMTWNGSIENWCPISPHLIFRFDFYITCVDESRRRFFFSAKWF